MICCEEHYTKYCPHHEEVNKILKGTPQSTILTNPFPPQQQQMVAQNTVRLKGGNVVHPSQGDASSSSHVLMCAETIELTMRVKTYDTFLDKYANGGALDHPSTSTTTPLSSPLHIEKPMSDLLLRPPKNIIHKSTFNPSAQASQNYNIVEDLAQEPRVMSTLEVFQHCPS